MGAVVCVDLDPGQFAVAREATAWVRAFYPDITVALDRSTVQLASQMCDKGELRLIWQSALANEILLGHGASRRAAVLDTLLA